MVLLIILVAGGGGGGRRSVMVHGGGGGGGAGGVRTQRFLQQQNLPSSTIPITVGAGGVGAMILVMEQSRK